LKRRDTKNSTVKKKQNKNLVNAIEYISPEEEKHFAVG